MITFIKQYFRFIFLAALLPACSKQKGFGPNYSDYSSPAVPVTVENSIGNRPDPTVTCSIGGDSSITVTMDIPASSKHTIKEITKVATSTGYTSIQSAGTSGFYPVAAIPGNGTTVTFKTTLRVYLSVNTKEPAIKVNTELANRYFFRITLDDGSVIYPTATRVLIVN